MGDIRDLRKVLTRVKNDIPKIASVAVFLTSDEIIEWQREQLWSGKTSTGGFIRPPYAPSTRMRKRKKGQPTDRVTLKDEGDHYEEIFVYTGLKDWTLGSRDWKSPLLQERYTPKIYGLNRISLLGYKTDLEPVFLEQVRKAAKL